MFGHEPAIVLHQLLGENYAAHVLALVYLLFLPVSPLSLIVFLVWSRNISYGYWYATAQCLAWTLGTVSYYLLPTLGPNFAFPFLLRRPGPDQRHLDAGVALQLPLRRAPAAAPPTRSRASPASPRCTSGSSSPWP